MMDTAVLDLDHENDFDMMQMIAKYLIFEKVDMGLKIVFDKAKNCRYLIKLMM